MWIVTDVSDSEICMSLTEVFNKWWHTHR